MYISFQQFDCKHYYCHWVGEKNIALVKNCPTFVDIWHSNPTMPFVSNVIRKSFHTETSYLRLQNAAYSMSIIDSSTISMSIWSCTSIPKRPITYWISVNSELRQSNPSKKTREPPSNLTFTELHAIQSTKCLHAIRSALRLYSFFIHMGRENPPGKWWYRHTKQYTNKTSECVACSCRHIEVLFQQVVCLVQCVSSRIE